MKQSHVILHHIQDYHGKRVKKTSVKLELLTDIDMLLMYEKGIRGGICNAVHRYAKANNKYMSNYDENEESVFLEFVDANNLYGYPMCEK